MSSQWYELELIDHSLMVVPPVIEHPDRVPEGFVLLDRWDDPKKPDEDYLFFQYGSLLVAFNGGTSPAFPGKYLQIQRVFPLGVVSWVFWALDHFRKPASQGGLEPGRIAVERLVDGEVLALQRGTGPGNHLGGLYRLINQNRAEYKHGPNPKLYAGRQNIEFWDLFVANGLLDVWKRMSDRYEAGELTQNEFDAPLGWPGS